MLPEMMLLAFAAWTLLLLLVTVGTYRFARIFSGRAGMASFPADRIEGQGWYARAMRAHANCIENLPVFGAIVYVLHVCGVGHPALRPLCVAVVAARVCQSLVHVSLVQTDRVVSVRFGFYFVQFLCFGALIGLIVWRH